LHEWHHRLVPLRARFISTPSMFLLDWRGSRLTPSGTDKGSGPIPGKARVERHLSIGVYHVDTWPTYFLIERPNPCLKVSNPIKGVKRWESALCSAGLCEANQATRMCVFGSVGNGSKRSRRISMTDTDSMTAANLHKKGLDEDLEISASATGRFHRPQSIYSVCITR